MFKNHNEIFTAPLAGITDKPFRKILRDFAPDVSMVTEMISCHSLVEQHKNCIRNFDDYRDEGNIGAQIFGADPYLMGEAAKILQDAGAKWVDINMGCPVPKVATRAGAGAYLMRNHQLAGQIIESCVKSVKIPVSIKTRLGWDEAHKDWQDLVHIAADSGASFAVVHGRTRAQGYSGTSSLPVKPDLPIPIIANGDIKSLEDIQRMQNLGYDGVMIGRAMLGRPWIIGEFCGTCAKPKNIGEVVLKHFDLVVDYYGAKTGVPMFRKHAAWYSAGMPNSAQFRIKVNQTLDVESLKKIIKDFFIDN
ncbi:MAG: tRNA dihydrouridine synthase DusB [Alphaproteobacteria bacterium]|nr:tRNA dihydrouridine synthase DusB [Alphaproteobacteria bacterium]